MSIRKTTKMASAGRRAMAVALAATVCTAQPAAAKVVRIDVSEVKPAFAGRSFGDVGTYEIVEGVARFELDPSLPANAAITNLQRAPRNARGMVEFDVDVRMLRPTDPQAGNGHLFFEPVNRGRPLSLGNFNGAQSGDLESEAGAGNGFLMREGYTVLLSGWQPGYPNADVPAMAVGVGSRLPDPNLLRARLPVAQQVTGEPVTAQIAAGEGFGGSGAERHIYLTYPAADIADSSAYLRLTGTKEPLSDGSTWRYASDLEVVVTRPEGATGTVELVYEAKDTFVYGTALAAMRDLMAYFRYDEASRSFAGDERKPITATIAFGASQTGRTVKTVAYQFSDDEEGRKAMDGAFILVSGASLNSQNEPFATPGDKSGAFPFTYGTMFDPLSREVDGVLMRCEAQGTCPKIIHADSESELTFATSLLYTDTQGADVAIPETARVYLLSGTQHGPADRPTPGICRNLSNPLPYAQPLRALLVALDQWIVDGVEPPASRHPMRTDGTLQTAAEVRSGFPAIPGFFGEVPLMDFNVPDPGSREPVDGLTYPGFLARTDADGNVVSGVRNAQLMVPLATYTGWNVPLSANGACPATGSFMPFAPTREARMAQGDPRLSVGERYPTEQSYTAAITRATEQLVAERLMLPEDAALIVQGSPERYRSAMRGEFAP